MPRNLDLTALRSFVAVADSGGVTRAAGFLNLTQSAVSMQIKRLEEALGLTLFDRSGRGVALTGSGELLLGYARQLLELNDEAWARLTCKSFEGTLVLGVPHDIVYPVIPKVLQQFSAAYPRVKVQLSSSFTQMLKDDFGKGAADLILTTEDGCETGGETLAQVPLVWVGAPGGQAWRQRPLRLAFEDRCIFRQNATEALDKAGIKWELAISTSQTRVTEATVSADLAIHAALEGAYAPYMDPIMHGGALPELPLKRINLYVRAANQTAPLMALAEMVREGYRREECARTAYKPDPVRSVVTAAE